MSDRAGIALRRAFACFPSGVTAVCALVDGRPWGMAVSSFTPVSLDPPLVSVCVAHASETWPRLADAVRIGVSVLAEDQAEIARTLALKGVDRFATIGWEERHGAVLVQGSPLWLECTIEKQVPAGDHDIVLLGVEATHTCPDVAPMIFHGSTFRQLSGTGPAH